MSSSVRDTMILEGEDQQATAEELAAAATFEHDFTCDGCEMSPIIGPRYHCQAEVCDFDLCQNCYQREIRPTNVIHTQEHTFQRILGPVEPDEEEEEEEEEEDDAPDLVAEESNNLPPTNVNYEQLLREYLSEAKKSEVKSDLLSSRVATELMWKSIKRITIFVLRCTRSPQAISAYHTRFIHSDPSRRGKSFPGVINLLEESFIWNEVNGPTNVRKILIEDYWATILAILGQQLHEHRQLEASGKHSYPFENQVTETIRFLPVFLSSVLLATPNAKGIQHIYAARQQVAQKAATTLKSTASSGVEEKKSVEEEKVDTKEVKSTDSTTSAEVEYHVPTVEEDAATFQFSVPFLPEFIQFLLTILVDLEYAVSVDAGSIFHLLLTIRPFREWLFQSEGEALVDLILDTCFGLCEQPLRRLTTEDEAVIKRIDAGETGLDDPRVNLEEEEEEDGNTLEDNVGIKYGLQLTTQLLGYAAETVDGADGHVTRQAIEKAFRILDRATQPTTDGFVVDQYEVRAAFLILRECLATGAISTKAGTPVFSSNDTSRLMDYIVILLGRPTLGPIAFGAIRLFLAHFKTMPLTSLNVTELMAPLVGPTFQKTIQILKDRTTSTVLRRQYMMLITQLLQWLPMTTIKADSNLIRLSMDCIEELLNTKSSPAELPFSQSHVDESDPANIKAVPGLKFRSKVDDNRNLLNPRIDGSRMNKDEHSLLYKCFFILRAAAMGQLVELKNEFTPYAPRMIELIMSASLHLPGLRTVFEMCSIQIWRCMEYEDALKLLPRYHQHLIHLMKIEDRDSTGNLSEECDILRCECFDQWKNVVEYFGLDFLPYLPDLVKYIKRCMHPKYRWAIETRPEKLAKLMQKRQARQFNEEKKEADAGGDEKGDGEDDDEKYEDGENNDGDQDDDDDGEEDNGSEAGEDEDENGQPIFYRTRWDSGETFESYLEAYSACCEFIGEPFRPYHEKELCPTLIRFLGQRGSRGSNELLDELAELLTVLPIVYGHTVIKRRDAIVGEHTFPVQKLSATSKTLVRKVLERVQDLNLTRIIQWYQGRGADAAIMTYDSLFYIFGTSVYSVLKKEKEAEAPPPGVKRRTHIEFGGGYKSKSGKSGSSVIKSTKSTAAKKKVSDDPAIQPHEEHLLKLIDELILTLIDAIKRLSTAHSVYPNEDEQEEDRKNLHGKSMVVGKYLRIIEQSAPDLLQEEQHIQSHRCPGGCGVRGIIDLIGNIYRLLGTMFKVAGHWFATKYEIVEQIHTISYQLVQYPVFQSACLWFFGDQCNGLTESKGKRVIPNNILTNVLQPGFKALQATLRRPFNLHHHVVTDTAAVLGMSDFLHPYAQLPHEFYGTDALIGVIDGLQQQIRVTYQRCRLYRARRQIEDPHQPFIEATLASLSVTDREWSFSIFEAFLSCSSMSASSASSPSLTSIEPPETTAIEYPFYISHLDECAHSLECLLRNRSLMKYCWSQPQLDGLPPRILLLFLCVLPLRIENTSLNHIYHQLVRISRQAPTDLQDEPWLTLKTDEQMAHVRSISRFAARRHAHEPTLIEASVLKSMSE